MIEYHPAYQIGENSPDRDRTGYKRLSLDLVKLFHRIAYIICARGDKYRISKKLEALAYVHRRHILCKYEDKYLYKKSNSRQHKQLLCFDLFKHITYERHDGKFQYGLEEIGVSEFGFIATQIPYDLDHKIIYHIMREEKAYGSDEKKRKRRVHTSEPRKSKTEADAYRGGDNR